METPKGIEKTKWGIDLVHSEISFKVKHLMITNVKGIFKEFDAEIYNDGVDFTSSSVKVKIKASSISTNEEQRDGHLKSADFFDVENYNEIEFTGTSFKKLDDEGNFKLSGLLVIKGISKEVNFVAEFGGLMKDPYGNEKAGFVVSGKINRKDWGLNWNAALEAGGVLLSDEVKINCELQLIKQK